MSTTYKLITTGFPKEEYSLKTGAYRVGSSPDNEIVIEDASVAPHHCEVVVTANTMTLRNLSPNHETFVNDKKIDSIQLTGGQSIRLGDVQLLLEAEVTDPTAAPGEQIRIGGSSAAKAKAGLTKPVVRAAMAMIGLAAIAGLIYTFWPESSGTGEESDSESSDEMVDSESAPDGELVADPNVGVISRSGSSIPAPSLGEMPKAFNVNETNRPPDLDVEDADLHIQSGHFVTAAPFLARAILTHERTRGPDDPAVIGVVGTLGNLYRKVRQYDQAAPLLQRFLKSVQGTQPADEPKLAQAQNDLGELYLASGDASKAAPLLEKALESRKKALKPDDPEIGVSLSNVAALHAAEGDYAKAKPMLEESLKNFQDNFGSESPTVAQGLHNLGELQRAMGDPESAEPLLKQALEIKENSLGPDDASLSPTLNSLAGAHEAQGEYEEAEPLRKRALEIAEKEAGPEHPDTAASLNNLAELYEKMGDPSSAAPLYEKSNEISEKSLGSDHPQSVMSLRNRAKFERCQGDQTLGLKLAEEALDANLRLLASMVRYSTVEQRLVFQEQLNPCGLAVLLNSPERVADAVLRYKGVIVQSLLEERQIAKASEEETTKGMVDALSETKNGLAELLFEIPEDLSVEASERRRAEKGTLLTRLQYIEKALAERVPGIGRSQDAGSVDVDEVERAIGADTVLVEYVRYQDCIGSASEVTSYGAVVLSSVGEPKWVPLGNSEAIEQNVLQFQKLLRGEADDILVEKEFLSDSETETIDQSPDESQESSETNAVETVLAEPAEPAEPGEPGETEETLEAVEAVEAVEEIRGGLLRELHRKLWKPIEPMLPPGTLRVIISPDSALNLVSFAALVGPDNQFLSQKYSIQYVSTGRDLQIGMEKSEDGSMFIFGNPDFTVGNLNPVKGSVTDLELVSKRDLENLQSLKFPKLAVAPQEVALVHLQASKSKLPITLFFGAKASEAELSVLEVPRIVHFGTLGFILPTQDDGAGITDGLASGRMKPFYGPSFVKTPADGILMPESAELFSGPRDSDNPIHRSGVMMAGAEASLRAWNRGEIPEQDNDGIVTADDLGTLDLHGTELVVISACDAGVGAFRSGEGVLALRRAAIQSGAAHLLIALRPEGDEETAMMIGEFYKKFRATGNAPQALAEVQRDRLVRQRDERGLIAAVSSAGAFLLSSTGPNH